MTSQNAVCRAVVALDESGSFPGSRCTTEIAQFCDPEGRSETQCHLNRSITQKVIHGDA
jgi:hypothetical protein